MRAKLKLGLDQGDIVPEAYEQAMRQLDEDDEADKQLRRAIANGAASEARRNAPRPTPARSRAEVISELRSALRRQGQHRFADRLDLNAANTRELADLRHSQDRRIRDLAAEAQISKRLMIAIPTGERRRVRLSG